MPRRSASRSWEQASDDAANMEWARNAWNDMKTFSTGGTYVNFLTEDEGPERVQAALGKGLARLAKVKAKWTRRTCSARTGTSSRPERPHRFVASTPSPFSSVAKPALRRRFATSFGTSRPVVSWFGVPV